MNKKITRRAVLGTVVGGFVVAPFVVRALRGKKMETEDIRYARFTVNPSDYSTDLSLKEVDESFDVFFFFRERKRWLSFRKFKGTVSMWAAHTNATSEAFVTLELMPSGVDVHDGFPWLYKVVCNDPTTGSIIWTQITDRNNIDAMEKIDGNEKCIELLAFAQIFVRGLFNPLIMRLHQGCVWLPKLLLPLITFSLFPGCIAD